MDLHDPHCGCCRRRRCYSCSAVAALFSSSSSSDCCERLNSVGLDSEATFVDHRLHRAGEKLDLVLLERK